MSGRDATNFLSNVKINFSIVKCRLFYGENNVEHANVLSSSLKEMNLHYENSKFSFTKSRSVEKSNLRMLILKVPILKDKFPLLIRAFLSMFVERNSQLINTKVKLPKATL